VACPTSSGGSRSLSSLRPDVRRLAALFIAVLRQVGHYSVTVTSTYRSRAAQARLYAAHLAGCSQYPAAAPGRSTHELRIAFDLELYPADYDAAGELWEALGGTWGGRFGDPIHFELHA
jgi:hypothetical protein